ncbi:MAG: hypothetical protein LBQ49_03070 [Rickettsiales bacterium]|jgi:dTDP-glucose pyrophosphorylase|nr:hypothetical protein [Rickettsiales bacterium]
MKKPTLLVLAAGLGSRYGGIKQIEGVGPSGEILMDYCVYDAIRAGFGRVVFVIRKDIEDDFRARILTKYEGKIETAVVFQSLDALPDGFATPADRVKPWGTNHAVLMAKDAIKEPFLIVNADDFYGLNAFETAYEFLSGDLKGGEYCIVGFKLENVLSETGPVSRGVCEVDSDGYVEGVTEYKQIVRENGKIVALDADGKELAPGSPISLNMIGFTPDYFEHSEKYFKGVFLPENINAPKAEFYTTKMLDYMIKNGSAKVKCIDTSATWFGVTYPEDRPGVVERLQALTSSGEYPTPLF